MPPPVSFITLSPMPFSQVITQAMFNVANEQWFKYTATAAIVMGMQATTAGTFVPVTAVFAADGTTPVGPAITGTAGHWQTLAAAADYYVQVTRSGGGASDADFAFLADVRPLDPVDPTIGDLTTGDLIVNDDADAFAAAVLDSAGEVKFFVTAIPGGETGAIVPSNVTYWHDFYGQLSATDRIAVFDADLVYITSVACGLTGSNKPRFGVDVTHDRVYVVNQSRGLWRISNTGVATNTGHVFDLTPSLFPDVIAVNEDGTILYWANIYSHTGIIHALDLTTFVDLPDLHTIAGFIATDDSIAVTPFTHPGDMFVMPNGNVVTWWYHEWVDEVPPTYHLVVISPSGTLLYQYDYASPVSIDHLAYIHGDSDHIFVWWFTDTALEIAHFGRLTLSTGAIDQDFLRYTFSEGENSAGTGLFGPSESCTFLRRQPNGDGGGPPDGPGPGDEPPDVAPSYHLDARYIRRLRRAPHVTNENLRVFYRKFELDLERGQGLATGQGSDPMVLLRISRDGGQTWGEEQRMAAGALGAYTQRVIARRLGQARDTVFEVVVSDPIAWSLVGAWLDLEPGTN